MMFFGFIPTLIDFLYDVFSGDGEIMVKFPFPVKYGRDHPTIFNRIGKFVENR